MATNIIKGKIISNVKWIMLEKIFRMGTNLLISVWIARYLGPTLFGELNFVQAYLSILIIIAGLGLDGIVVRNLVKFPKENYKIIATTFWLKLASGLVLFIGTLVINLYNQTNLNSFLLSLMLSTSLIFQSISVIDFWLQSKTKSKVTSILALCSFSISSILKIFAILTEQKLWVFGLVFSLETLFLAIGFIFYIYKVRKIKFPVFDINIAKSLMRDSWPLMISNFAVIIYMKIDQLMIGQMLGLEKVGIYSTAVKLAEMWYFIPMAIITSTFPTLIEIKIQSTDKYYEKLQNLYDLMSLLGYLAIVPVVLGADYLITVLYGEKYREAATILILYIWAGIFVNLGSARSSHLKIINDTRFHLVASVLGCVINILLNFILIPKFGMLGATYSTLISYWIQAHLSCYLYPKMYKTGNMITLSVLLPFRIFSVMKKLK